MWVLVLIAGLLLLAAIQAAIWIPLILWFRRRSRRWQASLREEIAASGETLRRGPEGGLYEGASFGYPQVRGNGVLVLTDRRLLFRKLTGGLIEVPLDEVTGVREDKVFLSAWRSGRLFLILQLKNRAEIGFLVSNNADWLALLQDSFLLQ